jgi:TM2 domain-containing membrane protein YozV
MIMIVEIVGTGTIVGTTVLTSWMISGATCSVIWWVISISKLRYALMLKAGAVDAAKAEAITTGVGITAIMVISDTMETIATMEDAIDPIDSTVHTGIRASMAHHHRVRLMASYPDNMESHHNSVHD